MDKELWAFLGVVLGGTGLKVVERFLLKKDVEFSHNLDMTKEFRAQIKELQDRQDALEEELTTWKDKYYTLLESYSQIKVEALTAKAKAESAQLQIDTLIKQVNGVN